MAIISQLIRASKAVIRNVLTLWYRPVRNCPPRLEAQDVSDVQKPDGVHKVLILTNGRVFSDLCNVVSVIKDKSLYATGSCVFASGPECDIINNRSGIINRPPAIFKGQVVNLLTGGGGNYNYYHWLFDVIPRLFLVRDAVKIRGSATFLVPETKLPFQRSSMEMLGVHPKQMISSTQYSHVRADVLVSTSHPKSVNQSGCRQVSHWICEQLRESFIPQLDPAFSISAPRRIYVSRGDNTNRRVLINEQMLMSCLRRFGFQSFLLSDLTFAEQISLFSAAEAVVAVHGAGLANLVFAPRGTLVIELATPSYCPSMFEDIAYHRDHNYHLVIGDEVGSTAIESSKRDIALSQVALSRIESLIASCV